MSKVKRWALISGTSTGLGRETALELSRRGVAVLAGVRKAADGERLMAAGKSGELYPVILDVTDPASIARAIQEAEKFTGDAGLWALVHNAGIVVPGPIEFTTPQDWRRQFDVNFFGLAELTRQALPLVRRGVRTFGSGVPRIMIVSSIGGRIAQPLLSPYTSSKWAATSFGDSLRLELRRQGIGVTVLEPGAIATAIWGKGDEAAESFTPDHPARALYGAELEGLIEISRKTARGAMPAEKAAVVAAEALFRSKAPARVLVGTDAKVGAFLRRWLPLSWFDSFLLAQFGMRNAPPVGL